MTTVPATYVDGRLARVHRVDLWIEEGDLVISGDPIDRREPVAAVEITDAIGSAPRLLRFSDGACCEPLDRAGFDRLLTAEGIGRSRVSRWERSPAWIAASLLILVVVLSLGYRIALPRAARGIASQLPDQAIEQLSRQVLAVLDRTLFERTDLSASRQAEIVLAFDRLHLPAARGGRRHQIQFRKVPGAGPNAMALPSGVIVLFDELVGIAQDDREILSVLAHEAGHVAGGHGQRQLLQSSAVALFITWFLGDMSAVAAAAPTALLEAKYSRDLEREADDYAVEVLRRNGIPTRYLAVMLERMERAHGGTPGDESLDYLSTHPATAERLERLKAR